MFVKKQIRYFKMQIIQIWIKQICVSKNKSVFQKTDLLFIEILKIRIRVLKNKFVFLDPDLPHILTYILEFGFVFWNTDFRFENANPNFINRLINSIKHKFVFRNTNLFFKTQIRILTNVSWEKSKYVFLKRQIRVLKIEFVFFIELIGSCKIRICVLKSGFVFWNPDLRFLQIRHYKTQIRLSKHKSEF